MPPAMDLSFSDSALYLSEELFCLLPQMHTAASTAAKMQHKADKISIAADGRSSLMCFRFFLFVPMFPMSFSMLLFIK